MKEKLIRSLYHGKWSPLHRFIDAVFICVVLTGFTGYAMFNPDKYISRHSIFNSVPQHARVIAGIVCIFLCVYAYLRGRGGRDAMVANVIVGPGLRMYDAIHQHAPVGWVIYGIVAILAALRVLQLALDDHIMADVITQARRISNQIKDENIRHETFMVGKDRRVEQEHEDGRNGGA